MRAVSRCGMCRAFVQQEDRFCWSCGSELRARPAGELRPAAPGAEQAAKVREADREVELAIRRAHLAQQRGHLEEAGRLLQRVLERDPENVPALSMLSEVLRARGDLVGAVAAAQRATEAACQGEVPAGALAPAREARSKIEESVVRELTAGSGPQAGSPVSILAAPGLSWYRSRGSCLALAIAGLAALFLAFAATLRGELAGYLWFAVSLVAAGWCYHDAETRKLCGLLWGPVVLCLGPFGLAIYLLARY